MLAAAPPPGRAELVVRRELSAAEAIQRDYRRDILARVGTKTLVKLDDAAKGAGGFKCEESGVTLRDSLSYLDHINGKKQMKALGMSMNVEQSTIGQVKDRFAALKAKKAAEKKAAEGGGGGGEPSFRDRVRKAEEEDWYAREERKEAKRQKREERRKAAAAAEEAATEGVDPDVAAMMGFKSFGGK